MATPSTPLRQVAVMAVRRYYNFLANDLGGIPADSIIEPPDEGWPSITEESMAGLSKTKNVIDILRHLPYIKYGFEINTMIAYETRAIDFTESYTQGLIKKGKLAGLLSPVGAGEIPSHVAVLSEGSGYGSWLLLDTEKGTVTDFIQQERPKRAEPSMDSPDHWHAYETWPVEEFFARWEEKFRSLEWTVNPFNIDDGMMLKSDSRTDEVRQIYREHGWPRSFRRDECHQALKAWHEKGTES